MIAPSKWNGMFRTLFVRLNSRIFAPLLALSVGLSATASAADSPLVVVAAPGKQALSPKELSQTRLDVRLKWATYHSITIRQPDGKDVVYARPDLTQVRMLNAPITGTSQFAIGDGMLLTLRPRRWEQATHRFVLETTVDSDADSKEPSQAEHTAQNASGTLQLSEDGKWIFVGESRWTVYSPSGDLVAEFSLGTFPETSETLPPPVAQRD